MIAVLAAMLFIGIVTASMLKNTKSQSAASIGYSTMQVMSSTTRSGMVATETYFAKLNNQDILDMMTAFLNSGPSGAQQPQFVFGNTNTTQELGAGSKQYFSSTLNSVNENGTRFSFGVRSGRGPRGKDLKKAMAYYKIADGDDPLNIKNTNTFGAKNAFYSKGPVKNLDAGIEVRKDPATGKGQVTFEGDMLLNSTNSVIFHDNVYVGGNVHFNDNAIFNDKVYFNGDVKMNAQAIGSVFSNKVGINGNFEGPDATINFNSDVWFNGNFTSANNSKFGTTTGSNFFYTDKIPMETKAMAYGGCKLEPPRPCPANGKPSQSYPCCPHTNHKQTSDMLVDAANNGFANLCPDCQPPGYVGNDISLAAFQDKLEMGSLNVEDRRDPQLNISKATDANTGGTDKTYTLGEIMTDNQTAISAKILNDAYKQAKNDNHVTSDGYMVIKLGTDYKDTWKSWGPLNNDETKFEGKVIFIAEGDYEMKGEYFPTTSESSTLIYMKDNAAFNGFKINGEFNGLIYIDEDNTASVNSGGHVLTAANNAKIVGAIHNHSTNNIQWNGGTNTPVVQFSEKALNGFGSLSTGGTEGGWTVEWKEPADGDPNKRRVRLQAMGYYFFP